MNYIKLNAKKSQISFEFILIFSIVFFVLAGFIYIINNRMIEVSENNDYELMKELGNNIKNEIMMASSVNNKYYRIFELPFKINGKDYIIDLKKDELAITLYEKDRVLRKYYTFLPVKIKGNFADKINESTKTHCITKNDIDGIRISKNQASLDPLSASIYDEYDFVVNQNSEFEVYVSLFCVNNVRSVQFTIKYDQNILEFIESELVLGTNSNENTLFYSANTFPPTEKIIISGREYKYIDQSQGRYTFGIMGDECGFGSGKIAKLRFKAKQIPSSGKTEINFDTDLGDYNIQILDCNADAFTKEDLPDTKKGVVVKIEPV